METDVLPVGLAWNSQGDSERSWSRSGALLVSMWPRAAWVTAPVQPREPLWREPSAQRAAQCSTRFSLGKHPLPTPPHTHHQLPGLRGPELSLQLPFSLTRVRGLVWFIYKLLKSHSSLVSSFLVPHPLFLPARVPVSQT